MRFILCYILGKSEICEETDLTDDDIMVFDKDQQW